MNETFESSQTRIGWLGGAFAVLFIILLGGLVTRQLIQYNEFKSMEERQSLRRVLLPAPRGVVYDRNGTVLISNRPKFSLIVYLGELRSEFRREMIRRVRIIRAAEDADAEKPKFPFLLKKATPRAPISRQALQREAMKAVLEAHLAPIQRFLDREIPLDFEKIEQHLYRQPLMPYTLLSDIDLEQFARLTELLRVDAPIQVQAFSVRTYPQGDLAAHTLGFVASRDPQNNNDDHLKTFSFKGQDGVAGIEKTFDTTLAGKTGYELWVVDPAGFRYEPRERAAATPGNSLTLTLDARLQKAIEKGFGNKIGAAAALDIHTGEVLALVSKPSYNPNDLIPFFTKDTDERIRRNNGWLNRAVQGLYPPGSTFKIITSLAAFENGKLDVDEIINCPQYYEVGGRKFPEHRSTGYGDINVVRALEVSANVFYYQVGLRLGPDAITQEAKKFGLDKPTGIELPSEAKRMLLPTPAWKREALYEPWYAGDTANMAIGQGYLLITPLQLACMTASLARGDTITHPTLIKKDAPTLLEQKPYTQGLARVIEGMKAAATTGTARLARVDGLSIAAKTGTAQIKSHGENLTLAWFVGFAPIDNPQVAIAIVVEGISADDEYAGGTTAAPIARQFFEAWKAHNTPNSTTTETSGK